MTGEGKQHIVTDLVKALEVASNRLERLALSETPSSRGALLIWAGDARTALARAKQLDLDRAEEMFVRPIGEKSCVALVIPLRPTSGDGNG